MAARLNVFRWVLFGAYLALTIVLSSMTRPPVAEAVTDTMLHAIAYSVMAILLIQALGKGLFKRHSRHHLTITAAFGVLYGAADEIRQYFTPGRHSSVKDAVVDAVATIAMVSLFALLGWLSGRRAGAPQPRLPASPAAPFPRIELLTREGCHLCDEARRVLESVLGPAGPGFALIDVDSDPGLAARYGEEIPVVLIDGVKRFKRRVEEQRLRRLLEEPERLRGRGGATGADPGTGVREGRAGIDARSLAPNRPFPET